ncbi:uncharacterized protein DSM5745_05528 [Aspergillus mulundensis]|uniref:Zn(2)-C6 fungal-type domain-containing protein n=1 Tax=Aspergillus mulundensis TaxID=1810919 RepID=A0A3D8RXF6_9EURO|nr:Uncharacterized protein DSM5745_05528 [Aspergillus mulundensis]RDW78676.1 Uncharacterized protein DSM5745_05528 [Aspergillus mulundensis]
MRRKLENAKPPRFPLFPVSIPAVFPFAVLTRFPQLELPGMPDRSGQRKVPCNNCKGNDMHGSDLGRPCTGCIKSNLHCVDNSRFRFKQATRPRSELKFASNQPWIGPVGGGISFVDETAGTALSFAETPSKRRRKGSLNRPLDETSAFPSSTYASPQEFQLVDPISTPVHRDDVVDRTDNVQGPSAGAAQGHLDDASNSNSTATNYPSCVSLATGPTPPLFPFAASERRTLSLQETCLIRHFIENLADSFDCTDKDKHFTYVISHRAMSSPVLFYAICTASAGHLVRRFSKQWPNRTPVFDNISLPNLTDDTVVEYHNTCISLFISMSNDPARNYDENVFAAATILRFYEQLDVDLTGLDSEIYLGVARAVVDSQPDYTFGSFNDDYPPLRTADVVNLPFTSLGYSVCLLALRQEIWSVLINRRPFRLFRRTGKSYNPPEPAGDFEWSNHIIFWCADVLRFCFGDEGRLFLDGKFPEDRLGQWEYLKGFKENWETMRPASFRPLYSSDADPSKGRYFPEIVHMNDCQVLGLQHFETACILLEVYDPQRAPIGPGATARNMAVDERVRQHTMTVCGLALSNKKSQATLVTAAIVISMCGETFVDPATQKALLDVLSFIKREHAWPSQAVLLGLQNAWELRNNSR